MIIILKCTIMELNSGPLDLQSDALPVELSMLRIVILIANFTNVAFANLQQIQ